MGRTTRRCHSNQISQQLVIDALTELFRLDVTDSDLVGLMTSDEQRAHLAERLHRTHRQIADVEQQRTRLALALAKGDMDTDVYRDADDNLKTQLDAWQRERDNLQAQLDTIPDVQKRLATYQQIHNNIDAFWTQPKQQVNALLRQFGVRVFIADKQITRIVIV